VWLIVGLGNPGARYAHTRHNVGFDVAWELGRRHGATFKSCPAQLPCESATATLGGERILIARPLTFMNRSGQAVSGLMRYYKLGPEDLMVIHDDVDQDLGRLKVVLSGGPGGHKGIISIIEHLGGNGFRRIKVGIGRPRFNEPVEQFVLEPFYSDQREEAQATINRAADACEALILQGDARAMSIFNA
jgi:PTH1 family peptidyl-tRNA hydrolase